jgi:hypothetical protein
LAACCCSEDGRPTCSGAVAFLACVVLAGIGMALALLLLGRTRKAPQERLEAVPVPIQND